MTLDELLQARVAVLAKHAELRPQIEAAQAILAALVEVEREAAELDNLLAAHYRNNAPPSPKGAPAGKPRTWRSWSAGEDAALLAAAAAAAGNHATAGALWAELSKSMGRTSAACGCRFNKLGLGWDFQTKSMRPLPEGTP